MSPITQQQHQDLVERILAEVAKQPRGALSKSAVEFVRLYYRHVPTAEILPSIRWTSRRQHSACGGLPGAAPPDSAAARVQPDARATRLALLPHGHRDCQ